MIKALLAALQLLPSAALACDCNPSWVARCTTAEKTLQAELERGAHHDDPTGIVAVEAEVIDVALRVVDEDYGSEKGSRTARVMRLLIRAKTYDAYSKAPLAGGVIEVVAGSGARCDSTLGAFSAAQIYKFVLEPSPYAKGCYRLPACGVYAEKLK